MKQLEVIWVYNRAKLKWWYKLVSMPEDRYPKQLFSREWETKPRRGRQRKTWGKVVDKLLVSLGLDKHEWVEDIKRGESSLASFLACIEESISEREGRQFEERLDMYKRFGKEVEFKRCLHGW